MKRLLLILFLFRIADLVAQPVERLVKVIVTPDHAEWLYKTGEPVKFTISVYRDNVLMRGAKLRYEVGPEKMEPTKKETVTLPNGTLALDGGTMKTAGFLRCTATVELPLNAPTLNKSFLHWEDAVDWVEAQLKRELQLS